MVIDTDFTKMCVILKFDIINVISYKNIKTVPYFIEYGILISPENNFNFIYDFGQENIHTYKCFCFYDNWYVFF